MQKIFVVEDDESIRKMVMYALCVDGFEVEGFTDGSDVLPALALGIPTLILLDIMLPGDDGISILKNLKQIDRYRQIPVIMLTAKVSEIDRVNGLDLGADDYISKPFSVKEAISRVKAVLRRCQNDTQIDLAIGGIVLNREKRTVFANGKEIILTYKEFELLYYLMINEGIVLSRDRLLQQVWGYDYYGDSRTVNMHIKTLRQKLGTIGNTITTVRNVGYKIGV